MSSQRRDSARERCDAELTELRLREKGASAAERAAIVQRKVDLKRMRGIGVYFEPPRATLPGGIALPWPAQGSGGGWWPSLPPLSLPELPHLPITLPTEVDAELFAGTFSFGSAMGLCSGIALKKLGKAAATVTGVIFMSITAAERSGYLSVNWNKVKADTMGKLDTDGDGELTHADAKRYFGRLVDYMSGDNVALTATSYAAGLVLGLRVG